MKLEDLFLIELHLKPDEVEHLIKCMGITASEHGDESINQDLKKELDFAVESYYKNRLNKKRPKSKIIDSNSSS